MAKKILFIDRDGTLITEPADKQIDSLAKIKLEPGVIPALLQLLQAGFKLIMVSNQDGVGTSSFPQAAFDKTQVFLLNLFASQGISFEKILICPHMPQDQCLCRKPLLGLVMELIRTGEIDYNNSYVIGDRDTDLEFANNIGIKSIRYCNTTSWEDISNYLINTPRRAQIQRKTTETDINLSLDLDQNKSININTGIKFFDHMLEQLAKHADFGLSIYAAGDLEVDEHHTVEDTAICLGLALRQALGDKIGIARYGFLLPMDEALAEIALDLSGRAIFKYKANIKREFIGDFAVELLPHFLHTFSANLAASLHIKADGENAHHIIESIFKGLGRVLRQAIAKQGSTLPTTKGVLC